MTKHKNKNQYHLFDYLSMVNVSSGFFSGKPHRNVTAINASIGKPKRILHNSFGEIWQRRSHRLVALLHTRGYWYNRGEGWWIKNMPEWKTMTCKKLESWLDWQLIRKLKTKLVESSWSPLAKDFYYLAPEAQFSWDGCRIYVNELVDHLVSRRCDRACSPVPSAHIAYCQRRPWMVRQ